jgi:protein-disulfide isomerase
MSSSTYHRHALFASQAAECAAKHDRFWQMHDLLISQPSRLDRHTIEQYASLTGLIALAVMTQRLIANQAPWGPPDSNGRAAIL